MNARSWATLAVVALAVSVLGFAAGTTVAADYLRDSGHAVAVHEYEHCKYMWSAGHDGECQVRYKQPGSVAGNEAVAWASAGETGFVPDDDYVETGAQHERIAKHQRQLAYVTGGVPGAVASLAAVTLSATVARFAAGRRER